MVALSVGLLGLDVAGPVWLLGLVAVADAVLGTALGLFVSAFAQTEFQAVQFMPLFVIPQILLCGLFVPRDADARRAQRDQRRAARCPTPSTRCSGSVQRTATAEVWRDLGDRRGASPWPPWRSGPRPCGAVRRSLTSAPGPTGPARE